MRFDRRSVVVGGAALLATDCASGAGPERVLLPDFRRRGDRDDSAALARALETGRPVHLPAGRYLIANEASATLPAGSRISGDGRERTIIWRNPASRSPFILHCDSGSPDIAQGIAGLRFSDLTFADDVARLGFSEFSYLVMLNGVSDVRFDRVGFRGFRGDGLHLGSGVINGGERHNRGVTVSECVFDGINANNRNAISVIDCDGLTVTGSTFLNCTRVGDGTVGAGDPMNPATGLSAPGPIDLEPNADRFAVVRNIVIRGNRFTGGGGFAVSLLLPANDRLRTPVANILIEDNDIARRFGAFQAYGYAGRGAAATAAPGYGIAIRGNRVRDCRKPFVVDGMRELRIADNSFADCAEHGELGYASTIARVSLTGNSFERIGGPTTWYGLWVRDSVDLTILRNRFVDCGTPGSRKGIGVGFVAGTQRRLRFAGNVFAAPSGRMTAAVQRFREATIDRATLSAADNRLDFPGEAVAAALAR